MNRRYFIKYFTLAGSSFILTSCIPRKNSQFKVNSYASPSPMDSSRVLQVGFVYAGDVGDFGWTYAHDLGRQEMEANLQNQVKTTFVEGVNQGIQAERVIHQLAVEGNNLIFITSFDYMNPTLKVAKDFPHLVFEQCGGYKRTSNVGTYLGRCEEPRYLTGMIAGKMTKSDLVGFVCAYPLPEVIRGINAFTQGVRSTNPQAKVKVTWVESWYNPTKEKEAALALVNLGADVLTHHTYSPAVVQLAEEKGIYAFGYNTDMSKFGEKAHLSSVVNKWGKFYTDTTKAVIDGTWKSQHIWMGINGDMVDISPMNPIIPSEVQELVKTKRQEFIQATNHPFDRRIKDREGRIRVPKGQILDDQEQLTMDWYVEGIEIQ